MSTQTLHSPKAQQTWIQATVYMALATVALNVHFILSAVFGPAAFLWIFVIVGTMIYISAELALALLLVALFMQNLFIAFVSPYIHTPGLMAMIMGTSTAIIVLITIPGIKAWFKMRQVLPRETLPLLHIGLILTLVLLGYSAYGFVQSDAHSMAAYARIYFIGIFLFLSGFALGYQISLEYFVYCVRVITVVFVGYGIFEIFMAYDMYAAFHVTEFMNLKFADNTSSLFFGSVNDVLEYAGQHSYLNLSGDYQLGFIIQRLMGPNLHPISYAYDLLFCGLVCFMYRSYVLMFCCFCLVFLVGAKGPLVMMLGILLLCGLNKFAHNRKWLALGLIVLLVTYVTLGIIYGIQTTDYHVIGLLGGVDGFMKNPFGYGIGVGGNMSTLGQSKAANFILFQSNGVAAFALESGFGVLLYQIGICTIFFLIFYWRLWKSVWDATTLEPRNRNLIAVPLALAFVLANSVFQEEAFSPAGWGLWFLFSGFLLSRHWRQLSITKPLEGSELLQSLMKATPASS